MSEYIPLGKACKYSSEKIKLDELTLGSYITTDNILQNKQGVKIATNLPPQGNSFPKYNAGNILVGNIRPYLKKIWFADNDGGCSADVLVFDVKKGYYPKFVYYAMFQDDFFVHAMKGSKGTKMPRGDKNQMMEYQIPDIDFNSQKQIASVLSALDSKIALNNHINAELEAMAKTVYDYWFVQFDFPINSNFAPFGETSEGQRGYKSSGGKMVWSEELKREIPEGWEAVELKDVAEIKYGKDHKKIDFGDIPIYGSGGIMRYGNQAIYEKDSILIPRKGSLSNLFYLNKPFWSVDTMFYTKMRIGSIGRFLFYYLQTQNISSLNVGTAVPSLTTEVLNQIKILIPSEDILVRFEKLTISFFEMIDKNTIQNQQLSSLRDWLLPMLMNGQVKV